MGSPFKIEDNHHSHNHNHNPPANSNNNNNNNSQSIVRTNLPFHNTTPQPILETIHSSFPAIAMDTNNNTNNNNNSNNRHHQSNNNLSSTFPFNDRNSQQKSGSQQNAATHSDSISNDNVNLGVSLPFGMASTEPSNEMDRKLENIFNTSVDSLVPLSPPLSLSLHQDFEEDDELDFMSSTNSGNVSSGRDDDDMSDFGGDVNFRRFPPPSCFTANKILIGGWLLTGGDMASSGSAGSEISDIHLPLQNSIQVRFVYGKHITKYEITQPAGSTLLIEYDFSLIVGLDFKTETKTIIIELNDTPTFKAKDGSKWINVLDFTQGNASHYRRHYIEFLGSTTAFTQQMAKLLAFDARLSSLADIGLIEPPENNFIGSPVLCDWDRENIACISCAECGNQNYCTECDEVLHRHPEKRHHKRVQTHSLQPHLHSHAHLHSIPNTTMSTATTASTTSSASAIHHPKRKKKKGERCRCGTGASKGTLGDPCTGNRCPCYSEGRSCANCGCKGCKNPYKDNPTQQQQQQPSPFFGQPQSVHIQHPLTIPNFSSIQGTTQNFSQLVSQASGSPPKDSPRLETNPSTNTQNPHFAQHSLSIDPSSHQSISRSGSPQSDTYHSPQQQNTSHLNPLSHTTAVNPPNNNVFATHHPHPIYHAPRHSHLSEPKIQTLPLSILHPLAHMNYHPTHISAMYHPPPSTTVANSHNNRVDDPKKS